ncbi:MAG: hypothetical protein U1E05_08695, partial [Patescibacteria group bacterium]|nr:hypothetical protein [Patescibacteria group bacterium]
VSRDPIGYEAEELNLYAYVQCGPVDRLDAGGLKQRGTLGKGNTNGGTLDNGEVPPDVPSDIGEDYNSTKGMLDCIFEGAGSANSEAKNPVTPPGKYFPGIQTPSELLRKCHGPANGECDRITLRGHGMLGGCGFISHLDKEKFPTGLYGAWRRDCPTKDFNEISECFGNKLKPGGYIRICSCGSINTDILEDIANATGSKVCSCPKMARSGPDGEYCDCPGNSWNCREPAKSPEWLVSMR